VGKTKCAKQNGGPKAAVSEPKGSNSLDEVDLGREIAGDFKTNFLLANGRLCPDFHSVSSSGIRQVIPVGHLHIDVSTKTPISFR
jgi:hypothetical protein